MSSHSKLHSVHALRFYAALAVIIFHLISSLGSHILVGAAGVDVFFVISGLVIGLSIQAGESMRHFATRRVIRVLPLYWILTGIYLYVARVGWGYKPSAEEIWRSIFLWPVFGSDWHPAYFPAWSLEYEMLFYGIAMVCIGVFGRDAFRVCLVTLISLAMARIPIPFGTGSLGTSPLIEFSVGMAISLAVRHGVFASRRMGGLLICLALGSFALNYGGGYMRELSWGVPGAMLIVGLLPFDGARFFRHPLAVLGGDISYALYLTHITTFTALNYLCFVTGWTFMKHQLSASLIAIPTSVLLAIGVRIFIERPLLGTLTHTLLPRRTPVRA